MKSLNEHVLTPEFDVAGTNLIEASAGTGKTYSIQTLFLRLVVTRGIPVQHVLVVTFTEAATKELRERLRLILEKSRRHAEPADDLDPDDGDRDRIEGVLAMPVHRAPDAGEAESALGDRELQVRRIRRALLDFDQASVFTIHGFCQRALQEFAFECSHDFDAEVVNGEAILRELCLDWWRRIAYAGESDVASEAMAEACPDVARLVTLSSAYIRRPGSLLLPQHGEAAIATATASLAEQLRETVGFVVSVADGIKTAVASEQAQPFFSPGQRGAMADILDALAQTDDALDGAYGRLGELVDILSPASIENPYRVPPEVQSCVDACQSCEKMISGCGMKPKGDDWGVPPDRSEEWEELLDATLKLLNVQKGALCEFLETVATCPRAFNKTELVDPAVRDQRLAVLAKGAPPSKVRTALKRVAALKRKRTVSWDAPGEVRELRLRVETVREAASVLGLASLAAGMEQAASRYDRRKRDEHGMTFDDMLVRLLQALRHAETADRLRGALAERYRAALIDEFQDTDPVQYRIFETLFAGGETPLFFVGDPKQAIYSFRGGDIFTYCAAKAVVSADRQYSLDTNYRSQSRLIEAVNRVFGDRDGASLFGREDIPYAGDLGCNDLKRRFVDAGVVDTRPFKVWRYRKAEGSGGRTPQSYSSREARAIYSGVAEEIVRLLSDPQTGFAPRDAKGSDAPERLQPSDVAILVRRHAEAAYLYRELRRRGVPAVRQAGDNVFDSPEASELVYVLQAMLGPGRVPAVKTALASELLPVSDGELALLAREERVAPRAAKGLGIDSVPATIDDWMVLFRASGDLWTRSGFSVAFGHLAARTGMKAWLASLPGGERRMVNVIQLQDLLHRAAVEQHLGPDALLGWFLRQLDGSTREQNDAFETRLESDADAVQIMTVFKSKGLEFPVVFVPTMWTSIAGRSLSPCHVYHDNEGATGEGAGAVLPRVIVQLDKSDETAKQAAAAETDQEDIRNLYVAATRASYRTYVVAGELGSGDGTVARCLAPELLAEWANDPDAPVDVIPQTFDPLPVTPWSCASEVDADALVAAGPASVDKTRHHTSFSSIAPHAEWDGGEEYDYDAADAARTIVESTSDGLTAFSFPAGARTGECWHRIFELLDFGASPDDVRAVVNEQLGLFQLDQGDADERAAKQGVTCGIVESVLNAELQVGEQTLRLADVKPEAKRAEVAFDFSTRASGGPEQRNAIWSALNEAWSAAGEEERLFLDRLRNWDRAIPGGFMTGFIDLFFEHDGRYYILDWKSNRLDGRPESFDRDRGLAAEIAEHAYFLQYLIYTVAIHRYLQQGLGSAYAYDKHFGGVLYLFVRGIGTDDQPGSQRGVFYTKPPLSLVERLADALMLPAGEGGVA